MSTVGSFGQIIFEVSAQRLYLIRGFKRTTGARVEEHKVQGNKARLEYLSPELDTVDFEIFFHSIHGIDPQMEIDSLRNLCRDGEAQQLIVGGQILGKFLLTQVDEEWQKSNGRGELLVASVKVTFKEYL